MLLEEPLYRPRKFIAEETWLVLALLYFGGTFDSFCVDCEKASTFRANASDRPKSLTRDYAAEHAAKKAGEEITYPEVPEGIYRVEGACARNRGHIQTFLFRIEIIWNDDDFSTYQTVQKIGQYPSFAQLNLPRVKQFSKILSVPLMKELSAAIGLASHDVGIGSYAYLRRVFEALIEDARMDANEGEGWDDDLYQRSRMGERIKMLRRYLPSFLVDNPGMYGLLSKGLHELSEEECLDSFPALLAGTELILEERLQEQKKAKRIAEATAALRVAQERHSKG